MESADCRAAVLGDVADAAAGAEATEDGQDDVLRRRAGRQFALDVDGQRLRLDLAEALGGHHVFHLGGADAEGQRSEGTVCGGMGVTAHDGHAGQGEALLGADDVNDSLALVAHRVGGDTEVVGVGAQRVDLLTGHRVDDRQPDVGGGHVVVLGGEGQLGPTHRPSGHAEAFERLRRGHLVDQVKVDVQDVGLALGRMDHVVIPDLLAERSWAGGCWSVRHLVSSRCTELQVSFWWPGGWCVLETISHNEIGVLPCGTMVAMSSTDGNPGTGVGVLDKAMSIVAALEQGPAKLAELTEATGMSRATVHRLASSLDDHGLLRRTADGSFALGYRLVGLAALALSDSALADTARPVVTRLRDVTGESAQLWLPDGEWRVCVVSVEATHELRTIVGEGARVPIEVGSGGGRCWVRSDPRAGSSPSGSVPMAWVRSRRR